MGKITDYTAVTSLADADAFLVEGSAGTRSVTAAQLGLILGDKISSQMHRLIYRGKSLGTSVTSAQSAAIAAGTFDDIFLGDYWTINSVRYDVADFDYWYNCGDTAFTKHHLVMVPHSNLATASMNSTNTTEGGYVGSEMYTTTLPTVTETISAAFGDLLLTHREYLCTAVSSGYPSTCEWMDSSVELMNEIMVYGSHIMAPMSYGTTIVNNRTIDKQQLALFAFAPKSSVNLRLSFWLRNPVGSSNFAKCNNYGNASCSYASNSSGVRPAFPIGA